MGGDVEEWKWEWEVDEGIEFGFSCCMVGEHGDVVVRGAGVTVWGSFCNRVGLRKFPTAPSHTKGKPELWDHHPSNRSHHRDQTKGGI